MNNLVKAHGRKLALAIAITTGLGVFTAWASLQVLAQWRTIDKTQAKAISLLQHISYVTDTFTKQLLDDASTKCSPENLKRFREALLSVDYISDVGVVDANGKLLCTSISGIVHKNLTFPLADIPIHANDGVRRSLYFDYPLYTDLPSMRVPTLVVGPFVVAYYPSVVPSVIEGTGIDAIFAKSSVGYSALVGLNIEIDRSGPMPDLFRNRLSSFPSHTKLIDWDNRSFFASDEVPGTVFYVQTNVPFTPFFTDNSILIVGAVISSLFVMLLVYFAAREGLYHLTMLRHRMKHLLTLDNVVCVYQPIVNLYSMEVVGCEVLMRLKDSDGSMIYPDTSIPFIIEEKLTCIVDRLVFMKAAEELTKAGLVQPNFKVAFNFFPDTVASGTLQTILDEVGLAKRVPGALLDVEILEHNYQDDVVREVRNLKTQGILISVDDFGTGYSNLKSIQQIAPDFLKIDRSFVIDMEAASVRSSLIPEILSIAKAVGARVIAEGIENSQQLLLLRDLGVEYGQGYFFAKPMSVYALKKYLKQYTPDIDISLYVPMQAQSDIPLPM